jgi:hypothetical protein
VVAEGVGGLLGKHCLEAGATPSLGFEICSAGGLASTAEEGTAWQLLKFSTTRQQYQEYIGH